MDYQIIENDAPENMQVDFIERHRKDHPPSVWKRNNLWHITGRGHYVLNCDSPKQALRILLSNFESYD